MLEHQLSRPALSLPELFLRDVLWDETIQGFYQEWLLSKAEMAMFTFRCRRRIEQVLADDPPDFSAGEITREGHEFSSMEHQCLVEMFCQRAISPHMFPGAELNRPEHEVTTYVRQNAEEFAFEESMFKETFQTMFDVQEAALSNFTDRLMHVLKEVVDQQEEEGVIYADPFDREERRPA